MLRQLPPTVTADQTPDWLPVGWISHSTVLKRGRQTRTYTHVRTGKKFSTKDQVLEYVKMETIREEREYGINRKKASLQVSQDRDETATETPSWLFSYGVNQSDTISENMPNVLQTHSKQEVLEQQNDMESEDSSEEITGCNQIAYIDESEEDFSETEYKCSQANMENLSSIPLRSQPERMQKLDSRAKTQCVFEDEEMSSDSERKLPETSKEEGCNEANAFEEEAHVEEENLHDKAREIPGLTGTFSIEINVEQEPASDSLVEKDLNKSWTEGIGARNVEIKDQQDSDLMHTKASSSKVVEVTQESLKAQAAEEETANESIRSIFFPDREAPQHSVLLVFGNGNSNPANDLINNTTDAPQEKKKIISGSKKREKNTEACSSKNIKKKLENRKRKQKKPQGEEKGSSSRVSMKKKRIDWPEPSPYFAFEPITRSLQEEDDSVIRRYLGQHLKADSNLPLPDFGLPSFSKTKISSLDEEEPESKKMKFPDPLRVQFKSSSLDGCSFFGTTMKQTVAGN